jgi:cell division protein FtsN
MDLAVYINELLGLEGEVNVPGIGRFVHTRINGYYNEKENKFYPPAHKINFDAEVQPDDRLATFISDKKNISLASSKYFIDKYVNGLKQQIPVQGVDIAGMGQLYLNGSTIGFRDDSHAKETDPAFFGLKPVSVDELVEKPSVRYTPPPVSVEEEKKTPSIADQVITDLVHDRIPPPPAKPADIEQPPVIEMPTVIQRTEEPAEEEYSYEEPVQRNNNTWIAVLLILIIALLALMGLYKYKPEWFDRSKDKPQTFTAVDTTAGQPADTSNTDTTKRVAAGQDSLAKAQALVTNNTTTVDTAAVLHYELLAGAFKSEEQANDILKKYQNIGLHPRILKHTQGNSYKITLGTYFDKGVAQKAEDSILNATKMTKGDIYLQIYKPKQ